MEPVGHYAACGFHVTPNQCLEDVMGRIRAKKMKINPNS